MRKNQSEKNQEGIIATDVLAPCVTEPLLALS